MPTAPQMSTSQALDISSLLIMLITVHGTTPKNSSMAVQHWMALTATSVSAIQPSMTTPSFAIFISAARARRRSATYAVIAASFACTAASSSFSRPMRPRISERSTVSTEMPLASSSFSL